MNLFNDSLSALKELSKAHTIHILTVGFEERCLAYLKYLSINKLISNQNKFLCISPTDQNVSNFLKTRRGEYRNFIQTNYPNISILHIEQVIENLNCENSFRNICVDISATPRLYVFNILQSIIKLKEKNNLRVFIVYSYPKQYMFGTLEEASASINYIFDSPKTFDLRSGRIIVLPGFDLGETISSLSHLHGDDNRWKIDWLIPFPGRKYHFYERTLETHLPLIQASNYKLFPMDVLKFGFNILKKEIEAEKELTTFIIPLGPRIICVPVYLASLKVISATSKVNIIFPGTTIHNSLRSDGYMEPLIEEVTSII